jgi:hypothetical protein
MMVQYQCCYHPVYHCCHGIALRSNNKTCCQPSLHDDWHWRGQTTATATVTTQSERTSVAADAAAATTKSIAATTCRLDSIAQIFHLRTLPLCFCGVTPLFLLRSLD